MPSFHSKVIQEAKDGGFEIHHGNQDFYCRAKSKTANPFGRNFPKIVLQFLQVPEKSQKILISQYVFTNKNFAFFFNQCHD